VCLAVLVVGCGEPPDKEMAQAQGAIDAARAAGADRFATAEFAAATDALARSRQAASGRDYRLALSNALASREHAQNAARAAAETRARLRGEAERLIAEVTTLLAQLEKAMATAAKARAPRPALRTHAVTVAVAMTDLQETNAMVSAGDYAATTRLLTGTKERIGSAITALESLTTTQTPRRRR
jgi:hypothetical protein